jgi:hypothetical protein
LYVEIRESRSPMAARVTSDDMHSFGWIYNCGGLYKTLEAPSRNHS